MQSYKVAGTPPLVSPSKHISQFLISKPNLNKTQLQHWTRVSATLRTPPRGFGPSPKKPKKPKKNNNNNSYEDRDGKDDDEDEGEEGVIPEVVTNRMVNRMGLSVGIPLSIGLVFFPFFYYLKVGLKLDVPNWVPFMASSFFFGSALLGVSYGIVSSSWDPLREGSLLGWKEAQKNWPVFWESLLGRRSN